MKLKCFVFQEIQQSGNFLIQPESKVVSLDTSQWPLLLKVTPVFTCNMTPPPSILQICPVMSLLITSCEHVCCWPQSCDVMKKFIHSLSGSHLVFAPAPVLGAGPLCHSAGQSSVLLDDDRTPQSERPDPTATKTTSCSDHMMQTLINDITRKPRWPSLPVRPLSVGRERRCLTLTFSCRTLTN